MSHIRIESNQKVVTDAKVFYVDGDTETDISSCVQVVDLHLEVGALATATLKAIVGHASRRGALTWLTMMPSICAVTRGLWRRRAREVTAISDRARRWA